MIVHGYTKAGAIEVTIGDVLMIVPDDLSNRHRQMIAEWEAQGNTIPPYAPPPTDPLSLPLARLTFWLAAAEIGVYKPLVRANIEAMPDGPAKYEAIVWFEEATVYRRNDPLLIQLAAAEGISEPQLDALWLWALGSP